MAEKTTVFAFGRMNPPTTGHAKLVDKVKEVAKSNKAEHLVVVSHSQDKNKNPLSAEQKLKHTKRFFPNTNIKASSKESPTFLQHAAELHNSGTKHLIMVAGSDRTNEYKEKLNKYNGTGEGKLYNFKSIKVVSAGERDPDAEGVEGMSASKMREHAKNNNYKGFRSGIPAHVSEPHAKELFNDVRSGMQLRESFSTFNESKMQQKIPFLLMNRTQKERLAEMNGDGQQLHFLNTTTQNFDMCPGALAAFKTLIGNAKEPEMHMMRDTEKLHAAVQQGIAIKPSTLKAMQFKQYLGL